MLKEEYGRRLTIIGLVFLAAFGLLDLTVFLHAFPSFVSLFYLINAGYPPLDQVMVLLTLYGREVFWVVLSTSLFLFGGERGKRTAFMLGILFLILTVVGYSVKFLEFRPRPFQVLDNVRLLVAPPHDSSFPSGHALISMGGAALTWLRVRRRWAILIGVESSLVAYSRIYVGVHYPMDALAGSFLGIAIACLLMGQAGRLIAFYDKLAKTKEC